MIMRRGTVGRARVDRRTKDLLKRIQPGEVAVIDHEDIDRIAAEGIIEAQVAAVLNASKSISGRYPTVGPLLLAAAGIPVIDDIGVELMDAVREGDLLRVDVDEVRRDGELLAKGTRHDLQSLEAALEASKQAVGNELEAFATNTLEYIQREARLAFASLDLPPLKAHIRGRHALVVVRGHDYQQDLAALRPYIREMRPVLVAVDGGADALLEQGLTPDVIIGDFDSVSREAINCGADLIHHVHLDGRSPGREALVGWGVQYQELIADGTSEDVAMLLAHEAGAELIVAVGTHTSIVEFLDKGRAGMASTFLTRLRVGPSLVDAKGVSRLYNQSPVRKRDLILFLAAVALAFVVVFLAFHDLRVFFGDGPRLLWDSLFG
jgi:uncharacterized membrane-anchored protein